MFRANVPPTANQLASIHAALHEAAAVLGMHLVAANRAIRCYREAS